MPRGRPTKLEAAAGRAREAAKLLAGEERRIRFLRSTFVPDDELCFLLFEAESQALVAQAAERAAIEYERILEAVEVSVQTEQVRLAAEAIGEATRRATLANDRIVEAVQ